jgi:predicted nucleotidyltransferase
VDVSDPTRSVTPSLDGPVLAVLATAGRPMTIGEIAQVSARGSEIGIRRCVDRLVAQGIVRATEMGRNRVHELNRQHVAAPIAIQMANLRLELINRLRGELAAWNPRPIAAWMFGSTARGDGDENSDIDLLLVRGLRVGERVKLFPKPPDGALGVIAQLLESYANTKADEQNPWQKPNGETMWLSQVDRLRDYVMSWTGNRAQIVELTPNELVQQRRRGAPLFDDIERDAVSLVQNPFVSLELKGS